MTSTKQQQSTPSKSSSSSTTTTTTSSSKSSLPPFLVLANGSRHSMGITANGAVYSWGKSNAFGQLGRPCATKKDAKTPAPILDLPFATANTASTENTAAATTTTNTTGTKAVKVFVSEGADADTGHSAILDSNGHLWMAGCDRWQQLGLGSSKGGSSGYTWKDGKLWQEQFLSSPHVLDVMMMQSSQSSSSSSSSTSSTVKIRDVALGGDHTVVLSSDQKNVYVFGKGGDGQLGMVGKPFVSAPVKSTKLSQEGTAAVCAIKACSMTLNVHGSVQKQAGKCRRTIAGISDGLAKCIQRAQEQGLIQSTTTTVSSQPSSLEETK